MGRSPCCDKSGLKKGPWTPEEDAKLIQYIQMHGPGNWRILPKNAGLERCPKSCRLRWTNYLRPDIKRGRFSFEEEETIIQLHSVLGNKWSAIAARLPGRTDNEIKNYWNTHIRKRLLKMGIDPVTHAPRLDLLDLSSLLNSPHLNISNLLRLQTLLNPDALRLAINLASSNINQNPDILLQKLHENNQFLNNNSDESNQFGNLMNISQQQQIPSNLTTSSYPIQTDQQSNMQNMGHFSMNSTNSDGQILFQDHILAQNTFDIQNFCYGDQELKADLSELNTTTSSSNNSQSFGFDSVLSSPAPPNSASTFAEDERDIGFCSNLLKFEIPESLDFDDFM